MRADVVATLSSELARRRKYLFMALRVKRSTVTYFPSLCWSPYIKSKDLKMGLIQQSARVLELVPSKCEATPLLFFLNNAYQATVIKAELDNK